MTKPSLRLANHGALTVGEKIAAGMDFGGTNKAQTASERTTVALTVEIQECCLDSVL